MFRGRLQTLERRQKLVDPSGLVKRVRNITFPYALFCGVFIHTQDRYPFVKGTHREETDGEVELTREDVEKFFNLYNCTAVGG